MPNKQRGEVKINLGGKDRVLKYDLNALADMESHFDCSTDEIEAALYRRTEAHKAAGTLPLHTPRVADMRYLIYVGLIAKSPDITEREVGGWIDTTNLSQVMSDFTTAFTSSLPEAPDEDEEGNDQGPEVIEAD